MNKLVVTLAAIVLTATTVLAQEPSRIYTRPALPLRDALDRLNLKMAWYVYVPMDGRKDGIFTVQHTGKELLVQTHSGLVVSLDPETGETNWRSRVGNLYPQGQPLGWNSRSVFVVNGTSIYALDRKTGQERWHYDLDVATTAAPVADND